MALTQNICPIVAQKMVFLKCVFQIYYTNPIINIENKKVVMKSSIVIQLFTFGGDWGKDVGNVRVYYFTQTNLIYNSIGKSEKVYTVLPPRRFTVLYPF